MGDTFDPYVHWLSLSSQRWKPTYYELLGIDRSQRDKDAIIARGKKLYAEVKARPYIGKEKEHQALLAEIEEAVRTFASNTKRAEYDAHLAPATGESADAKLQAAVPTALAAPKVPAAAIPERTSDRPSAASNFAMPPMAVPAAPTIPPALQSPPQKSPPAAKPIARPLLSYGDGKSAPMVIRTERGMTKSLANASAERHRKNLERQRSLLIAFTVGGILLLGGLGFIFREQVGASFASAPVTTPNNSEKTTENLIAEPVPVNPSSSNPIADSPPAMTEPTNSPETSPPNTPEVKPEPTPEVKPETNLESKPPPDPTPPTAPVTFTIDDAKALAKHCAEIVAALKARNATRAAEELEKAQLLAKPQAAKETVEQLAQVVGPFRVFWGALDEAFKSLKVGDEIAISATTKAKVASIGEKELEIEIAGGKRKQSRDSLSTGLLLALVRTKLDTSSADGKLAVAVFHLLDNSGNAEEGGKLLAEVNSNALSEDSVKSILAMKFDFDSQVTTDNSPSTDIPTTAPTSNDVTEEVIKNLRAALTNRELEQSVRLVDQLESLATAPDAKPKLLVEIQLAKSTLLFWDVVSKKIASFKGLEEIKVGDDVIVVVENAPNKLICRVRGKRAEYTTKNLPPAIAMAIAEMTAAPNSASFELSKGAFYFTMKPADVQKAKTAWLAAKEKGAEGADRLLTLAE